MADLFRFLGPEIMVHFRYPAARDRPWQSSLTDGYRSRVFRRVLGIDWRFVALVAAGRDAQFCLCSWEDPTELLSILIARLMGRDYVLWTDTPHIARKRSRWKVWGRGLILRFAFGGAKAVMGTGAPALRVLREMGCPPEKLVNFPYFVDVDSYRMRLPSVGPVRFLSCGRLVAEKGFDVALRALARYRRDFTYRIAGTGPELKALQLLAEELGIADRVEFPGWLEPSALRELYRQSDVLLHPAWFEPYGVCVLEAMASGMVVVGSSATAAVADRIVDGVNGLVHEPGDVAELAEKLARIDFAMGLAARQTAEAWPLTRAREILGG
jgi:glycosyltransferase involved in cell wall biosynthesis